MPQLQKSYHAKPAFKCLDEGAFGGFSGAREVDRDLVEVCPLVEQPPGKLAITVREAGYPVRSPRGNLVDQFGANLDVAVDVLFGVRERDLGAG